MNRLALILIIGMSFLFSCSPKESINTQSISVDIDSAEVLALDAGKDINYVYLESSTEAFSKNIRNIFFANDTIIRFGQDKVSAFDKQGKYLFDYSKIGEGPEEFVRLNNVFIKNGVVNMYDGNTRRLLRYSTAGVYIDHISCKKNDEGVSPSYIFPYPGTNNYIILPTFIGGASEAMTPLFGLYDETLTAIRFSKEPKTHPYINAYFPLVQFDKGILYNDSHSYDIFYVDENLTPELKYTVDYGKYAISKSLQEKGPAGISKALVNESESLKYKSIGVNYLNNTQNHLIFACSGKGLYLVSYDKISGRTKVFSPRIDSKLRWIGFLTVNGNQVTIAAESKDNYEQNFILITFPLDKLI